MNNETWLWLVLLVPAGDIVATVFFSYLFWISKHERAEYSTPRFTHPLVRWIGRPLRWLFEGRSWLLGLLAFSFLIITITFCYFGVLLVRRFIGLPTLTDTAGITTLLIVVLGTIPIVFLVTFWVTRRTRGGPPPFSGTD